MNLELQLARLHHGGLPSSIGRNVNQYVQHKSLANRRTGFPRPFLITARKEGPGKPPRDADTRNSGKQAARPLSANAASLARRAKQAAARRQEARRRLQEDAVHQQGGSRRRRSRSRGARGDVRRSLTERYKERLSTALACELREEEEQMNERLTTWPRARLAASGYALYDLRAQLYGTLFRSAIIRLSSRYSGPAAILPEHKLTPGTSVTVCRTDPLVDEDVAEALVMDCGRRFIDIVVPFTSKSALVEECDARSSASPRGTAQGPLWRMDAALNAVTFQRASAALETLTGMGAAAEEARGQDRAVKGRQEKGVRARGQDKGVRERQGDEGDGERVPLRDVLLGSVFCASDESAREQVQQLAASPPPWAKGAAAGALKGAVATHLRTLAESGGLNASQMRAIQAAFLRRLTLWQGPPGTGKTRTLVNFCDIARHVLRRPILACADSNVAVDNIVRGLLQRGVKVVRVGQPARMDKELWDVSLDALVLAHPTMRGRAEQLRARSLAAAEAASSSRGLGRGGGATKGKDKEVAAGLLAAARQDWALIQQLEAQVKSAILDSAEVVCATCVGAGDEEALAAPSPSFASSSLSGCAPPPRIFPLCVLDEASQCTEPCSLIPLMRGIQSVVMVGDPRQLPPTVVSQPAVELGLQHTLFERLQATVGIEPYLLDTQYRMHPDICAFPSRQFYAGRLVSAVTPAERPAPPLSTRAGGLAWPDPLRPLAFVDSQGLGREQLLSPDGKSLCNQEEARLIVSIARALMMGGPEGSLPGVTADSIGIITPYAAQVATIRKLLEAEVEAEAEAEGHSAPSEGEGARTAGMADVEVNTVDGFQGREKEVILISTVRSNEGLRLGFVADARRLNVALTRAKRGLIVVGSSSCLRSHPDWQEWVDHMMTQGLTIPASSFPLS
eukprot:jgi/Mesvir1/23974/Mv10737-RA.1